MDNDFQYMLYVPEEKYGQRTLDDQGRNLSMTKIKMEFGDEVRITRWAAFFRNSEDFMMARLKYG